MWRYEGRRTLDYFLKRRDCTAALAESLGVEPAAAVPTVMAHILEGVAVSTRFTQALAQCLTATR